MSEPAHSFTVVDRRRVTESPAAPVRAAKTAKRTTAKAATAATAAAKTAKTKTAAAAKRPVAVKRTVVGDAVALVSNRAGARVDRAVAAARHPRLPRPSLPSVSLPKVSLKRQPGKHAAKPARTLHAVPTPPKTRTEGATALKPEPEPRPTPRLRSVPSPVATTTAAAAALVAGEVASQLEAQVAANAFLRVFGMGAEEKVTLLRSASAVGLRGAEMFLRRR